MWQETKHGLYKQFNFDDFKHAWAFMTKVAELAEEYQHHPRWENEWNVVQIWLITHESDNNITDKDHELAQAIDAIYAGEAPQGAKADSGAHPDEVKIFADGGSRGNPGPSASGFVVLDMEDNVLVDKGVYLGVTTNNQAEYTALKLALEECQKMGAKEVHVYMDSLLVVNQMKGIFKIRNRDLWPIHDAIKTLAKQFQKIGFQHVPREFNKLADAAVNRALDEHLGKNLQ
ncbi:MAG TPA: reverse transcriptase-like protein [Candidatus Saccharimonadales bacterium]|nr:reverse transcriptase-like protein [Candidatus Saccharimonadales bacterium]